MRFRLERGRPEQAPATTAEHVAKDDPMPHALPDFVVNGLVSSFADIEVLLTTVCDRSFSRFDIACARLLTLT